jgi:hypothetical protein
MTKPPTDTQRAILRAAAKHSHGLAAPPAHLPPAQRATIVKALLAAALLAPAEGDEHQHPGLAWKLEGEAVLLRITEAGLQAIGAAWTVASPEAQAGSGAEPTGQAAAAVQEGAQAAVEPRGAGGRHPRRRRRPPRTPQKGRRGRPDGRRFAGRRTGAVLAAWDGAPGVENAALAEAVERLRQALAKSAVPRTAPGPRLPRTGTKQEAVLALLRRLEGASGPQIIAFSATAQVLRWRPPSPRAPPTASPSSAQNDHGLPPRNGLSAQRGGVLAAPSNRSAGPGRSGARPSPPGAGRSPPACG